MSLPEVHIGQIRQEIALMTRHGHIVEFEEIASIGGIEWELQNYLRCQDEKDDNHEPLPEPNP